MARCRFKESDGWQLKLRNDNGFAGIVYARHSKPRAAAVSGQPLASGCEIVLARDLVVAECGYGGGHCRLFRAAATVKKIDE